jgi:long-chain fatty acid transport protein
MRQRYARHCTAALVLATFAAIPVTASAAGFALSEQGVRGLGHAYAGGAALAEDASTIFFNPAGMTRLEGQELVFGMNYIDLRGDFTKDFAVDAIGQPLSGGEGGNLGEAAFVPNAYYHNKLNDQLHFGVGLSVPFGLATDYDDDSIFRYQARRSDVAVINIAPSIAYKVNDIVSLGFGLNIHYMDVELRNAVDFGAVCFSRVDPVTCTALGLTPQSADGSAIIEGDGMGYGFTAGALFEWDHTRVGINYRSKVDHSLSGRARFRDVPEVFLAQGVFLDDRIEADFESPDFLSLSVAHQLNDRITLYGDITRTGWSVFEELRVEYNNPNQPDTTETFNYSSGNRYSIGMDYRWSDAWTFRGGLAFDETPVSDLYRSPRLPDEDRTWIAFGATWRQSPTSEWDFGYVHLLLDDDIPLDHTGSQGDRIVGSYEVSANIFAVQYRYLF